MECPAGNEYTGDYFGLRIASVFILFAVSTTGAFLPLLMTRSKLQVPHQVFFVFRYVGSGVIVSTAFIHLLAEGQIGLSNPCLGAPFTEYPFSSLLALIGVFLMFTFDICAHRKLENRVHKPHNVGLGELEQLQEQALLDQQSQMSQVSQVSQVSQMTQRNQRISVQDEESVKSDDMVETSEDTDSVKEQDANYYLQMLNCFILEFGIIFHSVFVGLSLAIANSEFIALLIAICFHQMFEGLGLGVRFAVTKWPKHKQYTPWLLSLAYSLTTPIAMAIGLGVRKTYPQGSYTSLIVNGVFDSLCGGILMYNGLVELMAHDFIVSKEFVGASFKKVFCAFTCLCIGAGMMALIGKWA